MTHVKLVHLSDAPFIPGLRFRLFRGTADFPAMADVIAAANAFDGIDEVENAEELAAEYAHLTNCDPLRDVLIAEVDGRMVGFSRVSWSVQDQERVYHFSVALVPDVRRQIERAMVGQSERRLLEIAADHPGDLPRWFSTWAADVPSGPLPLLTAADYRPVRYFVQMRRPSLDEIPEPPLPEGLELRPVELGDVRSVLAAQDEAFRDHWGHRDLTDEDVAATLADPNFDPTLWRVAWDGDEIAGVVENVIFASENEVLGVKRGWLSHVSVRRPWRRRGLARALIAESLRAFRDRGMSKAGLGVDTENPTGALGLYERLGFEPIRRWVVMRKAMPTGPTGEHQE